MMKTDPKRIVIKIASQEQHENARNTRKTLKVLQAACDKENVANRTRALKDLKSVDNDKTETKHKVLTISKAVQTGEATITAEDLMSDEPSQDYWKLLAEQRGCALDDSFKECERLKGQVDILKEENKVCKEMLDESQTLVEVLQEMINEHDQSAELGVEATEEP